MQVWDSETQLLHGQSKAYSFCMLKFLAFSSPSFCFFLLCKTWRADGLLCILALRTVSLSALPSTICCFFFEPFSFIKASSASFSALRAARCSPRTSFLCLRLGGGCLFTLHELHSHCMKGMYLDKFSQNQHNATEISGGCLEFEWGNGWWYRSSYSLQMMIESCWYNLREKQNSKQTHMTNIAMLIKTNVL